MHDKGVETPFKCTECNRAYLRDISATVFDSDLYHGKTFPYGGIHKMFKPAAKTIEFIDDLLLNPRVPSCHRVKCNNDGHLKSGVFLSILSIGFYDVNLWIDYYQEKDIQLF